MLKCRCLWTLLLVLAPLALQAAEPAQVEVLNFPALQQIKGTVAVDGPMSHARYVRREEVLVPISRRGNLEQMADLGVVETEGFTAEPTTGENIPLALVGWVSGCATIWSSLFMVGNLLYGRTTYALLCLAVFAVAGFVLLRVVTRLWQAKPVQDA